MKLDFIIAGGVATGTSFLSATLTKHPQIFLPTIQRPEPNFFHYTYKFEKGLDWYKNTWFHNVGNEVSVGERSSLLMPSKLAPKRIKEHFPKTKLIFCIRNPIERAWGNYRFTVLEGLEPLTFPQALDAEAEREKKAEGMWAEVQPHAYVGRSMYASCLQEYVDLFGRDQIHFIKSEELSKHTDREIEKVCQFLGVDSEVKLEHPANYSSPSVRDRNVQVELRNYFGSDFSHLVEAIRREENLDKYGKGPESLGKISQLRENLYDGKNPLLDEDRKRLQEIFKDEIARIGDITGLAVKDWT